MLIETISQKLIIRTPLAPLCPAQIWKPEISAQILNATDIELFGSESENDEPREMRLACRAGLLLLNDDLEASHNISQQIETPTGSFWHAIMHRREGDFSNSNYWWRRVGSHPVFPFVYSTADHIFRSEKDDVDAFNFLRQMNDERAWKPDVFVAACEKARSENQEKHWHRVIQWDEIMHLFHWCHAQV